MTQNAFDCQDIGAKARKYPPESQARCVGEKRAEESAIDYEVYPAHIAYKIYQKGMPSFRCKRIGDGSFFVAKRSWDRLAIDFPTTTHGQRRLLPLAFEGDARLVYEEIASSNPTAQCQDL